MSPFTTSSLPRFRVQANTNVLFGQQKLVLGFLGCGKMGTALIKSFCAAGYCNFIVYDPHQEQLRKAKKQLQLLFRAAASPTKKPKHHTFSFILARDPIEVANACSILFLAVKPQDIAQVVSSLQAAPTQKASAKSPVASKLVVSIAAGVQIKTLQALLPQAKIIRVMPNIACLVKEMAAGYAVGKGVSRKEAKLVHTLLQTGGKAFLLDEKDLDVVTALSGSGPAFFASIVQAMANQAQKEGLDPSVAYALAVQTMKGTAALLETIPPDELVRMVASPHGTTVAGLQVFEKQKLAQIIQQAVAAAAKRSRQLAKQK
ncbi:MAG: pyrroline-5-carboxylate reductase [Candidatus Woesearchaeota archaeon]